MKSHRLYLDVAFACTVHPAPVKRALHSELRLLGCVYQRFKLHGNTMPSVALKPYENPVSQQKICLSSPLATSRNPANHSCRCFSSCHSPRRDFLVKLAIKRNARELMLGRHQSRCDWRVEEEGDGMMCLALRFEQQGR